MGLDLHTHFVTVGQSLGRDGCPIPDCGKSWIPTLPPVVLDHWPAEPGAPRHDAFTTVGHWRSYGSIEHEGVHYGQRAHSLRQLIDLPRRTDCALPARARHPPGRERRPGGAATQRLGAGRSPTRSPATPRRYAEFVRGSKAELRSPRAATSLRAAAGSAIAAPATWPAAVRWSRRTPGSPTFFRPARGCSRSRRRPRRPTPSTPWRRTSSATRAPLAPSPRSTSTRARCCPACSTQLGGSGSRT